MSDALGRIWVFYPHDGDPPVFWTEPCPFPYQDEADCIEYIRADCIEALEARAEKAETERDALRGAALAMDKSSSDALTSIIAGREALRDVAKQAIDVIESVQTYSQPDDPTEENALTMREHEVFGFDVESARAALNREPDT